MQPKTGGNDGQLRDRLRQLEQKATELHTAIERHFHSSGHSATQKSASREEP
jgi:hypothetical protein